MIQGKGQDDFHDKIMKPFMEKIMKEKITEIIYINKFLKSMDPTQKRKMPEKTDKCDICGRMFVGVSGLKTHKTRAHGSETKAVIPGLTRCDSAKSESSRSPPPKKAVYDPMEIKTAVLIDLDIELTDNSGDQPQPALETA